MSGPRLRPELAHVEFPVLHTIYDYDVRRYNERRINFNLIIFMCDNNRLSRPHTLAFPLRAQPTTRN